MSASRLIRLRGPKIVGGLLIVLLSGASSAADQPLSFNRDIRPILSSACFQCHGPDAGKRQGDLRLDEADAAKGRNVPAIVPGQPDKSPLYQRIIAADESERMPPPDSKKVLTAAQQETLKKWIEQGAHYQKHWSFEPIQTPRAAATASASPIDALLNERIEQAGLSPQPAAARETQIRRVAFTITGLPPTIAEVDLFLADSSPSAYERMVDRYLASSRYGEEMARHWLDVARYADTHGLHLDNERQMWAYRDWVVKAFNDNRPFDEFTVWQLAGDLLPHPTTEQLIATGFNRCNVTTSEGGSIEAEFIYRYAVERASTVAQAWLGLTAGCAVCHDHKFDPISTKEFYSLYAFFHSAADPAMDGNINVTAPFLKLPGPRQQATAAAAGNVEREARAWLETVAAGLDYRDPSAVKEPLRQPIREVLFDEALPLGATSRSSSRNAVQMIVDPSFGAHSGRRVIRQASAAAYTDTLEFKLRPLVAPHEGAIEAWLRVEPLDVPKSVTIGLAAGGRRAAAGKSVTWTNKDGVLVLSGTPSQPVKPGAWMRIVVPLADLGLQAGEEVGGIALGQNGGIAYWDALALVGEIDPAGDPLASFSAWRKAIDKTAPPEMPADLAALVKKGPDEKLSVEEAEKLRRFYLAVVARPASAEIEQARRAWEAARAARLIAEESAPGTFVFRDLEKPRESFIMLRGQYDKPGEKVEPGVPAVLPPLAPASPGQRLTRLDLAKWLVAPENPLTARVTANRLWQQVFGTGLVRTSFDFGSQGEPASHPELLDWLAHDFQSSGWNVKRFVKQLVMTAAFQRNTKVTTEMLALDPANRLYARGPRFRLDAEQVRDNALFVSGLLNQEIGGRGTKPYQPPNIWEPVGYTDSNTRFYQQDHGADLYRRSLYVFLKRTAPPPFMSNFDAPNREQVCTVRERSNTPLQALQLMNDVQHFEAARALAERILTDGGKTVDERIEFVYRTVLSRIPTEAETQLLSAALGKQRALYENSPQAANDAIHYGESKPRHVAPPAETAAWTMIANLVLNLDETVNRN